MTNSALYDLLVNYIEDNKNVFGIDYKDYDTLKYCIITTAIFYKNKIKQEVQALFKELKWQLITRK